MRTITFERAKAIQSEIHKLTTRRNQILSIIGEKIDLSERVGVSMKFGNVIRECLFQAVNISILLNTELKYVNGKIVELESEFDSL